MEKKGAKSADHNSRTPNAFRPSNDFDSWYREKAAKTRTKIENFLSDRLPNSKRRIESLK